MPNRMCSVEWCSNEISDGCGSKGGKPICDTCRGWDYSKKKATDKQLLQRRETWRYWESRMDYLHPNVEKLLAETERSVRTVKRQNK